MQRVICAEKTLFGPETLKGIKMPSKARRRERAELCSALPGTPPRVHSEGKNPVMALSTKVV